MANRGKIQTQVFKFFSWDEDPIGKYKQPMKNDIHPGSGYPQTDIGNDDVMVKGRWMKGVGKKKYIEMRGHGAAERGTKHLVDDRQRSTQKDR